MLIDYLGSYTHLNIINDFIYCTVLSYIKNTILKDTLILKHASREVKFL